MESTVPTDSKPTSIKIYKYMETKYALQALRDKELKVSTIDSLNDPFEMVPTFTLNGSPLPKEKVDRAAKIWKNIFSNDFGMICTSIRNHDPVLWTHYADGHRGIALGFDYLLNETLLEVSYCPERVTIDMAKVEHDKEYLRSKAGQLMDHKFTSWQYEKEYRIFVRLSECTNRDGLYFKEIPEDFLTDVILGAECETTSEEITPLLQHPKFAGATISKAQPSSTDFAMEIKPVR